MQKINISEYRMTNDNEPLASELKVLMHEVAIEAKQKAAKAKKEFNDRLSSQIKEAMNREGYGY